MDRSQSERYCIVKTGEGEIVAFDMEGKEFPPETISIFTGEIQKLELGTNEIEFLGSRPDWFMGTFEPDMETPLCRAIYKALEEDFVLGCYIDSVLFG